MKKEEVKREKSGVSLDWLIGGVLSKIGDTFDRITGRNWNPSSSLATSKLIEKLRLLMDAEVRDLGKDGRFVPHVFTLKIQWNKFSTDSDEELRKLEHELHAAAIDHINDRLYHTYAPLEISVSKDYFVEGVRFTCGFGKFSESEDDETEVQITLANIPTAASSPGSGVAESQNAEAGEASAPACVVRFRSAGRERTKKLDFASQSRFSVGRAGTNDIVIDDASVSKSHAAIALNREGKVLVADTGSTNGTFVSGHRIAYGKTAELKEGTELRFGDIEMALQFARTAKDPEPEEPAPTVAYTAEEIPEPAAQPTASSISPHPGQESADSEKNEDWEI